MDSLWPVCCRSVLYCKRSQQLRSQPVSCTSVLYCKRSQQLGLHLGYELHYHRLGLPWFIYIIPNVEATCINCKPGMYTWTYCSLLIFTVMWFKKEYPVETYQYITLVGYNRNTNACCWHVRKTRHATLLDRQVDGSGVPNVLIPCFKWHACPKRHACPK